MHKISNISIIALSLALVGSLTGCKNPGEGSKNPDPVIEDREDVPTEQAKAQFAEIYANYVEAKKDGSLSAAECESVTKGFNEVYESNKQSMLVARFNVGAIWEECGDMQKATKIYKELGDKNFHLALNALGVIAWGKGDHEGAFELFARSVEADKTQAFAARNNLAAAHRDRYADKLDQEDFNTAEKQIKNVLAVDTSNKAAYENLARLYYDRGRLEDPSYLVLANLVVTQALRVLEKEGTQSADIWNLEGLLFMQQENQVDALKAFKRAVEIEPNHADANRNIGFIAIRFRDYTTAEKSFDTALETEEVKHDVEVYIAMGVAKRGLEKFAEAEEWYRKAAELDKKDPRPWYNLAVLNQDHLIGQDNVDQPQIEEFYKTAKQHCAKFKQMAEGNKAYAEAVKDCVDRMAIVDDTVETFEVMKKLEEEVARLAELEKQQEEERRKRLRELEEQAAEAGQPSPEKLADAEAKAEADAAKAAKRAEEERKAKEQEERDEEE
jgi:tetratricopeptide (TPR) repeat protein